jgi:hypothetical protein
MKTHNLTPLVRWACRLSAAAVVVLAVAGMSCSTNGEADTGDTPTKAAKLGKPVAVQAWVVQANSPLDHFTADAAARAARGDLKGLFPDSATDDLGSILKALEDQGKITILQAPVILTRIGEKFSARSGLQIPVQTMVQGGLNVQYVDATVRFEGVVEQPSDGLLDVDISVKKQTPRYDLAGPENPNSPIHTADGSGRVVVVDGGTAVFAGIKMISGLYATERREANATVSGELVLFIAPRTVEF